MNRDLKEIYKQDIEEAEEKHIQSNNSSKKPIMVSGLLSPQSTICIQQMQGMELELDEEGMLKMLEILGTRLNMRSDIEMESLVCILSDVYSTTEDYLGGHGVDTIRQNAYLQDPNNRLKLSQIQGKRIGKSEERTAMAHQMLSILESEGSLSNFTSFLTNSHITDRIRKPHSFIVLKHKIDLSRQYLFDVENLIHYTRTSSHHMSTLEPKTLLGISLYPMTEQEFEDFREGKSLCLKSIYEHYGMPVFDSQRKYGEAGDTGKKPSFSYEDDGSR